MSKLIVNSIEPQVGFTSVTFTTEINTASVNVSGVSTFSDINVKGAIYDSTGSVGQTNQVLVSNAGAGVTWSQIESIPTGVIVMWSGSIATIPNGWALCDGTGTTPDLRDRFIVGAHSDGASGVTFAGSGGAVSGNYAPGNTGGVVAHQLTTAEMPSHSHSYSRASSPGGGQDQAGSGSGDAVNQSNQNTSSQGSNHYHENRPPYYALAYIMKT